MVSNKSDEYEFYLFSTNINSLKIKLSKLNNINFNLYEWDPSNINKKLVNNFTKLKIHKIFLFHALPFSMLNAYSKKVYYDINFLSHIRIISMFYNNTSSIFFISSVLSLLKIDYKFEYCDTKRKVEDYILNNKLQKCKILRLGPVKTGFEKPALNFLSTTSRFVAKKIIFSNAKNKQIITIPNYFVLAYLLIKILNFLKKK